MAKNKSSFGKSDPVKDLKEKMSSALGFDANGKAYTEEDLPWYRDSEGNIVFKDEKSQSS